MDISSIEATMRATHETLENFVTKSNDRINTISDKLADLEQKRAQHFDDGPPTSKHKLSRVLKALSDPRGRVDGYEKEWSDEYANKSGLDMPGATWVPLSRKSVDYSALSPTAAGSNLVATEFRGNDFIDLLRQQSTILNLGVRMIPAEGNVAIPKATAGCTAYWVSGDFEDLTEGNPTYSSVTLQPKFCGAYTRFSLKMAVQSGIVEDVIRRDLAAQLAQEIDKQAIQGDGSGSKITGILNTSGINATTWSSSPSVPITWSDVLEAEKMLLDDLALSGSLHYLVGPAIWKQLKSITKAASDAGAGFLMDFQNGVPTLNGYPVHVSSHVPAETLIFGNFEELLVGTWGALALASDPYSDFKSGAIGVRAFWPVDLAVRHAVSFCKIT